MHKSTLYVPFIITCLLVSCSNKIINTTNYNFKADGSKSFYANLNYWAAHPLKKDMSDNVPKPLGSYDSTLKQVDVFFIHPTTLLNYSDGRLNATLDDINLNKKKHIYLVRCMCFVMENFMNITKHMEIFHGIMNNY